jgi:hypothetical protein
VAKIHNHYQKRRENDVGDKRACKVVRGGSKSGPCIPLDLEEIDFPDIFKEIIFYLRGWLSRFPANIESY